MKQLLPAKQCEACRHEFTPRRETHTRCDECFSQKQSIQKFSWSVPLDSNDIRSIWLAWRSGRLDRERKAYFFDLIAKTAEVADNRARDYANATIVYIDLYERGEGNPGRLGVSSRRGG